jgi:hypothetical protein
MLTIPDIYAELIDYLASKASPEEILAFQVSEASQARALELLEQGRERRLALDEMLELEQMRHFDGIISALKARAMRQRHSTPV